MSVPRPVDFIQTRRLAWPGLAALGAAGLLFAWQAIGALQEVSALQDERLGVAALARQSEKSRTAMSPEDRRRHAQIDALALRLATPWHELLGVFERRSRSAVRLVRLEQEADSGLLRFVGTARSTQAMMDYVISLESESALADVRLRGHETRRTEIDSPVQFEVEARWRSSGQTALQPGASGRPASGTNGRNREAQGVAR